MADAFDQSRTEAPTQRRREDARRHGQVVVSSELTAAMMLLGGVGSLWLGGEGVATGMITCMRQYLVGIGRVEPTLENMQRLTVGVLVTCVGMMGTWLAGLFVLAFGVVTAQVGWFIAPDLLLPNWSRLSPGTGWSRILSASAALRGVAAVLKVSVVAVLAWWVLRGRMQQLAMLAEANLGGIIVQGWRLSLRLALVIAAGLVLIGLADYAVQRWRHERSLMMSREEVKEEMRREEGDPLVRARIRRLIRETARKRMMGDVPRATVVITNPTHLAIAILYERGKTAAPKVLAKGAGFVAKRIVELARSHAIPVVERKPVAQVLFKTVEVGQEIPLALYYAVAEVLAYVYRLRGAA